MDTVGSSVAVALPPIPVELTIRFATALPDLTIFLPNAAITTISSLKRQIRTLRRDDTAKRKLKLIYGGKVLVTGDGRTLAEQMRLTRPIASPTPAGKGKGKAVETDLDEGEPRDLRRSAEIRKAYIHCAVGDEATEEELSLEDQEGTAPTSTATANEQHAHSTLPQPLGFDRLLSAGFTEADVAQLRAQFNRIHNISLDSPPEMSRILEERWIDEAAGTGAGELADGSPAGTYEDMFIGVAIGFFWPVAVLALREEGIFTKRRGMAIVAGLLVNLLAAVLRFSS
ncbi:hypothetical protein L211DRAFT_819141 [Terfezia boudieri ATCC MYA-4762]|uniref:Ubiquitin-like domain-containing protein n=1 Tax=Terfezia boudieri ATCC MYA-4762 TaxID=1051890 RepID=A0A3N4LYW2_9PEZI|nr:hypothetical protein L211DRAFT_819141 [Terfezia boudieri ATCC MYA-4762]